MSPEDHGEDLVRLADYRPTAFDARGLGSEGMEDWRVLPVVQTRDSGPLEASNFTTAERILDDAGATYETLRFGHWGPGRFEIIAVRPDDVGLRAAGEIACVLDGYPVLDDDDHSERELDAAQESWDAWQESDCLDRIESEVSDRAYDLICDHGSDALYDAAMRHSAGYRYDSESPSWDLDPRDITRDDIAGIIRAAREARDGQ